LPSSSLSDPEVWLHIKWSQPPPRAPEWVFDYYERYNPPASVGRPLRNEEWLQCAFHEDLQAAGLAGAEKGTGHNITDQLTAA
jgi:hypothetical protein